MHLKRLAAPKSWAIKRKESKWIVRPSPGAHKLNQALPLLVVLRDLLKYGGTSKEIVRILNSRAILVNGKVRTSPKFAVGLMDILDIPTKKEQFLVSLNTKGNLTLEPVKNRKYYLSRVENKTVLSKGQIQLNLFGGRNYILGKDEYKVGDSVKLSLKDNKIIGKLELKKGANAFIFKGSHKGRSAQIKDIFLENKPKEVLLKEKDTSFKTRLENIFVVE